MVKVFFDHQKFSTQRYGGISRYFASIIHQIKGQDEFDYQLGVLYSENYYLAKERQFFNNFIGRKLSNSPFGRKIYTVNELYCKYLLQQNKFDVFHPTYYDPYFLNKLKKPMVTTIHDMTYEVLPEYFWSNDSLTLDKRLSIERANKVIAISETTKKDLLRFTNINENKIEVIYHGIDINSPLDFEKIDNLSKNYILFVGDRSGYKNFYLFLKAFAKIHKIFPELNVVLVGGGVMGIADVEYIRRLGLSDKITHILATDGQLNYLYKNALLFVYPSLYEGFGLPILEAFKAQCPILLSNTECFKEVAGDAAVYFDSLSLDDFSSKLENTVYNNTLKAELVKKGNSRLQDFPLDKCNNKTLKLYQSII